MIVWVREFFSLTLVFVASDGVHSRLSRVLAWAKPQSFSSSSTMKIETDWHTEREPSVHRELGLCASPGRFKVPTCQYCWQLCDFVACASRLGFHA